MFAGAIVALVTPFTRNGDINYDKVKELVAFHLRKGTRGLVPSGTTGESPTLSKEEKIRLFETVVNASDGGIPVIAGTGNYNTEASVEMTRIARQIGADAALVITPYYNKPTQEGLYRHFMKVADEGGLPVIIYNVPGRTSVNILPETIARLAQHERIVGVKEASGNLNQISEIHRRCGDTIAILSGDDALTLPILSVGGKGTISVTANLVPERLNALIDAFSSGDVQKALRIHHELEPLNKALFLETNPIPVKTAMNMLGMEVGGFRLPLCEMGEENQQRLRAVLIDAGLLC